MLAERLSELNPEEENRLERNLNLHAAEMEQAADIPWWMMQKEEEEEERKVELEEVEAEEEEADAIDLRQSTRCPIRK